MATIVYPDRLELVSQHLMLTERARRDLADPNLSQRERISVAISQGYDDPQFRIADVEAAVGIGERRVRQILAMDDPPTSFRSEVHERRIAKAEVMLASTNYLIDYVAYLCGFKCASTFAAQFKNATGVSPHNWRRHYGGTKRAGGTTGCFRAAAERARARREGEPEPPMTRIGAAPGDQAVMDHEIQHAVRQARLRGELGTNASIAQLAEAWARRGR